MSSPKLGFVGFGEAGHLIAKGLVEEGLVGIHAFDVGMNDPARREVIAARADDAGATLTGTAEELFKTSDIIIAAVTSSVAVLVAKDAAPYLTDRHTYIDINSVSPAVKIEVGDLVSETGAAFVEAAVMAALPKFKHKVPMLLCGSHAEAVISQLKPYGMDMEYFGSEFGKAAAFKMFRSIMIKGMEALLLETAFAASKYDVADEVFESVGVGYPGIDWQALATQLIGRTAIHGQRRAHEMMEVSATLTALGVEPIMSAAAAKRIQWGTDCHLKEVFNDEAPNSYHEVIKAINDHLDGQD